jgi:hypothetical protein
MKRESPKMDNLMSPDESNRDDVLGGNTSKRSLNSRRATMQDDHLIADSLKRANSN